MRNLRPRVVYLVIQEMDFNDQTDVTVPPSPTALRSGPHCPRLKKRSCSIRALRMESSGEWLFFNFPIINTIKHAWSWSR